MVVGLRLSQFFIFVKAIDPKLQNCNYVNPLFMQESNLYLRGFALEHIYKIYVGVQGKIHFNPIYAECQIIYVMGLVNGSCSLSQKLSEINKIIRNKTTRIFSSLESSINSLNNSYYPR